MTSKVIYTSDLQTHAIHTKSQKELITDAPIDNNGKGSAFSPSDLTATSLASCMLTIIGMLAQRTGFSIDGAEASVTKIMNDNPRRIGEIVVEIDFPANNYSDKVKEMIRRIPSSCPVSLSLHPEIKQTIKLNFK